MRPELRYLELRAEWLQFKGSLFDPNTGLPALPAVLEHVRRRVEAGTPLGLLYFDVGGDELIETAYGWESYERLLREAGGFLMDLRGRLLHAEDTVAVLGVRDDEFIVFAEVRDGGDDRGALARLRELLRTELNTRLRAAFANKSSAMIDVNAGSALLRPDPTMRIERTIYRAIDDAKAQCRYARDELHPRRLKELRRILDMRDIEVRYQPIVRMSDRSVIGFEALSRGPVGDLFENAEVMFTFAERTDLMPELERLCRVESLRGAALEDGLKLFLNTSARSFHAAELLSQHGLGAAGEAGLRHQDIVIEITERTAITEWHEVREVLKVLRRAGCGVAIDDVGSGYSSLKSVVELEPDYLKFEISLVRDIHLSPIKQNLLETLLTLAEKIGAKVVAEGVESDAEYQWLRSMGVMYGQGYFFGRAEGFHRHRGSIAHVPGVHPASSPSLLR